MTRFTTIPIRSARSPVSGVETLAHKLFPGLGNARVIRREKKRVQGGGSRTLHLADEVQPLIWDPGLFLVDGDKIASHAGMRDVVLLCIKAGAASTVPDPLEFSRYLIPGCRANIFEDNNGRTMVFNPTQHAAESTTGLSVRRDILFLVVQVRIVDARCPSHKYVDVPWNGYLGSIRGGAKVRVESKWAMDDQSGSAHAVRPPNSQTSLNKIGGWKLRSI